MTGNELIKKLQSHPELLELEVLVDTENEGVLAIDTVTFIKTPYKSVTIHLCEVEEPEDEE